MKKSEEDGKTATSIKKGQSGRWGVGKGCNCQHMLSARASLIRAQRYEMALLILEEVITPHR